MRRCPNKSSKTGIKEVLGLAHLLCHRIVVEVENMPYKSSAGSNLIRFSPEARRRK
jgi:hypothetical protein